MLPAMGGGTSTPAHTEDGRNCEIMHPQTAQVRLTSGCFMSAAPLTSVPKCRRMGDLSHLLVEQEIDLTAISRRVLCFARLTRRKPDFSSKAT